MIFFFTKEPSVDITFYYKSSLALMIKAVFLLKKFFLGIKIKKHTIVINRIAQNLISRNRL